MNVGIGTEGIYVLNFWYSIFEVQLKKHEAGDDSSGDNSSGDSSFAYNPHDCHQIECPEK